MLKKLLVNGMSLILMLTMGCNNETIVEFKGPIVGFVELIDEKGFEIQDKSNITVKLNNKHSATTNADGKFSFENIAMGTYQIVFEKQGFGTIKKFNYIFAGGDTPGVVSGVTLVELSKIEVTSKQLYVGDSFVRIEGTITETNSYYFIYFIINDPTEEIMDYEYAASGFSFCCVPVTNFSHTVSIPSTLSSPLYLVGYASSTFIQSQSYNYYDYEKNKFVNPLLKRLFEPVRIR